MENDSETKFVLTLQHIFDIYEAELNMCETVQYKRPVLVVDEPLRRVKNNKRWRQKCLKSGEICFNNQ